MIRRSALVAAARAANAIFFLVTAGYCLLTYNAFAYQQFIRPHLILALTWFVVWHGLLYWLVLLATALTLLPLRPRASARRAVLAYLAASAAVGLWLLKANVLPDVENSFKSLVLAVLALTPPIALAVVDHIVTADRARTLAPTSGARAWTSVAVAAAIAWLTSAAFAPRRVQQAGDITLNAASLALGMSVSALYHAAAFAVLLLVMATIVAAIRRTNPGGTAEYWWYAIASAAGVAVLLVRIVFAPIAFTGAPAWTMAAGAAAMLVLTWSSIARYRAADAADRRLPTDSHSPSALDVWLMPIATPGSRVSAIAGCVVLPLAAFLITSRVSRFDWNFMLQQLVALAVWIVAFACAHAATGRALLGRRWLPQACAVLVVFGAFASVAPRMHFLLDGYAATDPSFKVIYDAVTRDPAADPAFYAYLRENTTIPRSVALTPLDVNFVAPLTPTAAHKPHIFFFLIDSLRPDYLAPYNRAVSFTPQIDAFARDAGTYVFRHAFARYGGTGLSVPAIWAGAMVAHQEYITPFAATNALEKLVTANGYRQLLTKDHITTDLFSPSPARVWLDRDVPEMQHTFCGTVREAKTILQQPGAARDPLFVHTRPLDLHVALVRSASVPAEESYPGFFGPYAARVKRIDACFGGFVQFLKDAGLYDDSIIVLTADHGDSLGDGLLWGHAYTLFPEVIRIPLIVHLPAALAARVSTDLNRVVFSTDTTPTLYQLLGYNPARQGPMFGVSLFDPAPPAQPHLIVSSYGAVYAMLSGDGRSLYIADAINEREYEYEITDAPHGRRVAVSDEDRARNRQSIRDRVEAIAAAYRFDLEQ